MGFFRQAVFPRWKAIVFHRNTYASVALGILSWIALTTITITPISQSVLTRDITPLVVAFTSMGFGVSITAVALVLALPLNRAMALTIVNTVDGKPITIVTESGRLIARDPQTGETYRAIPGDRKKTGYLDLVFTFVWTAMANVWAATAALVATAVNGNSELMTSGLSMRHVFTAIMIFFFAYAALQLFSALLTVYQVAKLIQTFSILEIEESGVEATSKESGRVGRRRKRC